MGRFNVLPEEIMLEILSYLPTESVLESKLVCKSWRDLVLHPSFSQMHLKHLNSADDFGKVGFIMLSREPGGQCYYHAEYDDKNCHETPSFRRKARMNLNPPFESYNIVGSCNGLICFSSWFDYNCETAYICNPITSEYIILPEVEGICKGIGFGYSLSSNEYKIVRLSWDKDRDPIAQVYTLGSGNGWRNVGKIDMDMKQICQQGEFADGALYWANYHEETILAFYLTDEKFCEVPSPPPSVSRSFFTLRVLGDFLSASYYTDAGGFEIWLLKKNKDNYNNLSWSKFRNGSSCILLPFEYTNSGKLLFNRHSKIYIYDPKTSSAKIDGRVGKIISQLIRHKNTLVSLKVLGERDTKTMEFSEKDFSSGVLESNIKLHNLTSQV